MSSANLSVLAKCVRKYSTKKSAFYVTTPIYYVNAAPHIGHLYSSVIADVIQRYQRLINPNQPVIFSTGTDEHGLKIQKAAKSKNVPVEQYCSEISAKYTDMAQKFTIGHTNFIRTTDQTHRQTVQKFWKIVRDAGHIYSSQYVGWYCVSDETFLSDSQIKDIETPDGKQKVSLESGNPVEWTDEQNYMFRLSKFQDELIRWLKTKEDAVHPKKFYKILMDSITGDELPDWSVSRPTSRIHWGVRVPGDESQTIHVWLDALINYLTVAKFGQNDEDFGAIWPPDVQVVGKDILKFHGIYWPAILMAANLEPPRHIFCHSHWTVDGQKMSKSKNNVICPVSSIEKYTNDGLRYFLMREGVAHSDGNFSDEKATRFLDAELANTLGNLLNRCTSSALNPTQTFPTLTGEAFDQITSFDETKKLIELVETLPVNCQVCYNNFDFHEVIRSTITTLHAANLFFETLKPWELKKLPQDRPKLHAVLHVTLETLRVASVILQPVIPNMSKQILDKLAVPEDDRTWESLSDRSWKRSEFVTRTLSSDRRVLFERVRTDETKKAEKTKRKNRS